MKMPKLLSKAYGAFTGLATYRPSTPGASGMPANVGGPRAPSAAKMNTGYGYTGLPQYGGYIFDEFLIELQGSSGRRKYREMRDNDATTGALLSAIGLVCQAVPIEIEASPADTTNEYAEFARTLFDDMDVTWHDLLNDILSMLPFGFSVLEMVFKYRRGQTGGDQLYMSQFDDGRVGIACLGPRAQETIIRWDFNPNDGRCIAAIQDLYLVGNYGAGMPSTVYLPLERCLLFRPSATKGNPEGRSILRNAYVPYYFLKKIQLIEAIAIERELAGVPVVRIPNSVIKENGPVLAAYVKIASDLKNNSQGGLVIPSDLYKDPVTGDLTNTRQFEVELLTTGGTRAIDTGTVIQRYQSDIARTSVADFLMLGSDGTGSFALSKSKSSLFLRSVESIMSGIVEELNRKLLATIWKVNLLPEEMMPKYKYGQVGPIDMDELGKFIDALALAGVQLLDEPAQNFLRRQAGLPMEESAEGNSGTPTPKPATPTKPTDAPEVAEPGATKKAYDDSEARDDQGQWTDGGSGPSGPATSDAEAASRRAANEAIGDAAGKAHKAAGGRGNPDYLHETSARGDAARAYVESSKINDYLRRGALHTGLTASQATKHAGELDKAIAGSKIKADTTVFRGLSAGAASKLLKPGTVFTDKAFISTSTNIKDAGYYAGKGGYTAKLELPKGSNALVLTNGEITLPRGTKFKVGTINNKTKRVTLTVVQ